MKREQKEKREQPPRSDQSHKRFYQGVGRFEIFLRDEEVVIVNSEKETEQTLTAEEASIFMSWLWTHKKTLHEIVRKHEHPSEEIRQEKINQ